ncbi:MAG: stage III sporulation protein AF [Oscillospiraceae bacterium]|jgi:hypothetical protein|nr:stage III sporulation protein AF [Oscillospiraceae bacterium]MCI1991183.1 stage III sporulation protein AF [Oscillospiraceae bacterium]
MSGIQQWTAVICLAALVAALAQGLIPAGSMERMGKFVVGAFVLCVMIVPVFKAVPKIGAGLESANSGGQGQDTRLESTVNSQVMEESQKSVANLVTAELSRIRIKCKNVRVVMDTNRDGRISINKVIVTLDKKDAADAESAAEYLKKELGLKTEVVSDGG